MQPVDLLMITHNRPGYTQKALDALFAGDSDFRLFCWDNGSTDDTADIAASIQDERLMERYVSPINAMQAAPMAWFLHRSQSDVIGKIDDDTLVPRNWIVPIASLVRQQRRAAMIGCWTYRPDDFERNRTKAEDKVVYFGSHAVLRDIQIGGTAFLMRKELAYRYWHRGHSGWALPIRKRDMTLHGLISGWYFPLIWAEHMDDPRSRHYMAPTNGDCDDIVALTAQTRGFHNSEEYAAWIMHDADEKLKMPVKRQIAQHRWRNSLAGRFCAKLKRQLA